MKDFATYHIKQGLSYPFGQIAAQAPTAKAKTKYVAILAQDYPGLKPSLLFKEGEKVKLGDHLIEDRREAAAKIVAPAAGEIVAINRAERRRLESVVIKVDAKEQALKLAKITVNTPQNQAIAKLDDAGILSAIRKRPFDSVATTADQPVAIFVNAMNSSPGAFNPAHFINKHLDDFKLGLELLAAIFDVPIHLCMGTDQPSSQISESLKLEQENVKLHKFAGPHPAGLAGTHINTICAVNENNTVWSLDFNTVISIGHLSSKGKVFSERWVALGPIDKTDACIIESRDGANINELLGSDKFMQAGEIIAGSLLFGRRIDATSCYVPKHCSQISQVLPASTQYFLGWGRLGTKRYSKMNMFLGASQLQEDTNLEGNMNGAARGLVPVETYDAVMPLNFPIINLLRSIIIGDGERIQELGGLGLSPEDMSLLTFVCPSKNDYCQMLEENLRKIEKEG